MNKSRKVAQNKCKAKFKKIKEKRKLQMQEDKK